jgi:hypothetical protein
MPTPCPALYWSELGAEFIVAKMGDQRFRCQFFYSPSEIFGTGRDVYDNLGDCVTTLLQAPGRSSRHACRRPARRRGEGKVRRRGRRELPATDRDMTLERARQLLKPRSASAAATTATAHA